MKISKLIKMLRHMDQNAEVGEVKLTLGTIELNLKDIAEISKPDHDTKEFDRKYMQRT